MDVRADFAVTVKKKEVVAALLPVQEHWLPFSNLDLLLPCVDVGVFFCYKKPPKFGNLSFASVVSALKKALAQALVSFYAFAGEVVRNSIGEPELLCNNHGVDFIEAYADVELHHLQLYNPDACVEGKLVPKKTQGVLSVQATELKCGGVVVACTFDHRMADAYSANMFLIGWAEHAREKPLSVKPSFRRSLLNPRRPGLYDSSVDNMYVPMSRLAPPPAAALADTTSKILGADDHVISRIYYITADDVNRLQSQASSHGCKRTKLESLSAFLWQVVAKESANNTSAKKCKMGTVVDGRTRLARNEKSSSSMDTYFGNVLSIPFGEASIEDLTTKPLSWVANAVHEYLEDAVTEEHFLGLIDWVEAHRPESGLAKIYCRGTDEGPAFVMSSGQRFPVSKVDFGWGKPSFGSYHFPWRGDSGYVMPMPSVTGNGDWIVYVHLLSGQVELLESLGADIFRPFTWDYLNHN